MKEQTMKHEMVTLSMVKHYRRKFYRIKATQDYMPTVNMGHWMYYILKGKDIVDIRSSCCAPPTGKLDKAFLRLEMEKFLRKCLIARKAL